MLPRIRYAEGLVYDSADHNATAAKGAKAWLLNFSENRPDPLVFEGASQYLKMGENQHLNRRYKTSIRIPWYRVPSVWAGHLLLSKRSHRFPRLVYNAAGVMTTDTIYRGNILPNYQGQELNLVAVFHNSLTLLSAEIEGRSFGGGVLELVPSEISRLLIPFPIQQEKATEHLSCIVRKNIATSEKSDQLVEATDELISQHIEGFTSDLMDQLQAARQTLLERRLSRNS